MSNAKPSRAVTGITGLDDILGGGLVPRRLYLIEGMPGSGKTTLAFQFLLEGVRLGEPVLYVTLSETREEIGDVVESHGWSLDGVTVRELTPADTALEASEQYTVFHPSEVELSETTTRILEDVEQIKPARIVIDSLSELRLLAGSALRYRRQILALKHFFAGRACTVLLLDDMTSVDHDLQVQSIAHGALLLEHTMPAYGSARRRLSVTKYRGSDFRGGYHDYAIRRGGLHVFPRLIAADHGTISKRERLSSGLAGLDSLLAGGMERGSSTLIQGASGTGKSTIASLFAAASAARGEHVAIFVFDESVDTLLVRSDGLGIDLRGQLAAGRIRIKQVDPAELTPGELTYRVRHAVEEEGACMVIIDSLNGYLNSMPNEEFLIVHLHEILSYLGQRDVATVLIATQLGLIGNNMTTPIDTSYLADAVMLMRYFEDAGEVKQALSVVKMRGGDHERTIREFSMRKGKISVGEPLRDYRGVLTGTPEKTSRACNASPSNLEQRLLIFAPVGRDAALICEMLDKFGVSCMECTSFAQFANEFERGAAAVLITEEALAEGESQLLALVSKQPPWSDLPIMLLVRHGADSPLAERAAATLGNVTLLERPVRVASLASAVRSALRVRERQYQTRRHLLELEQADQRKDQFLATLAHELRNPLAPILNSMAILQMDASAEEVEMARDIMDRQLGHLVRLVDDLLEVSRITRGKIEVRRAQIDLAEVIKVAVETSRPLMDNAGHHLSVKIPPEKVTLDGDSMRLAQVFSNLLNNAARYTDPNGKISIGVHRENHSAVVTVQDNGVGIPIEALPRVFDMFTQVDRGDKRAQGGLGIGLTLVRSLVEMHGGSVTAASGGLGTGSTFTVKLPLKHEKR